MNVCGRVRPAFAVVVVAALAACGGGGGGGSIPGGGGGGATPVPTATPAAGNFVAASGPVTLIPPASSNKASSSMLTPSTDGTFVVQSQDTPVTPSGNTPSLTEYDVTASQTGAGVVPGSHARLLTAARDGAAALMPFRPRLDPRSAFHASPFQGRSPLSVIDGGRSLQSVRRPSAFTAGTTRVFHVQQGTITGVGGSCTPPQIVVGTSCYVDVTTTLRFVSTNGYVWVDNAIDASYNMGAADWSATGAVMDNAFAKETAIFGPAFVAGLAGYTQCDASMKPFSTQTSPPYQARPDLSGSDPHISILITNALENTGEGGYFDFLNDLADQEVNCVASPHVPTNSLPMFVIGADKYQTSGGGSSPDEAYWRTQDMPRSVPHEFQHYLHALNKVLKPDLTPPGNRGQFDDSFVDEGDSMLAEDLVLAGNTQSKDTQLIAWEYLFSPGNYSLTAFTGYDANPLDSSSNPAFGFFRSTAGNYGGAYLFARYLYDRFGAAGIQRLYADVTPATSGTANTHPIVSEANNGETFAQLYADFAAALGARNVATGGDPRFSFSAAVLLRGTSTQPIPGGATWDIVFNGPRSPEDITSAHPQGLSRIKLTPSGTVTAKLISGATLFFNVAPAGGSVVSATVSGAPLLTIEGVLTQGAYDDSGACLGPAPGC